MATIKNFNGENFNVNVVDAMNLTDNGWAWYLDLKVEVTDKETGINVYDTVLKSRMVPMWDSCEDWYEFIENKIEDGADLDEELEYCDAGKDLQKEFDDWFEERYIDWFLHEDACGYELDDKDLAEIFDDDDCLVIIDGENVWFTASSKWDSIGYNMDTENEVYECDEYIIEETNWNEYEVRDKNDIKIVKDLFEHINEPYYKPVFRWIGKSITNLIDNILQVIGAGFIAYLMMKFFNNL